MSYSTVRALLDVLESWPVGEKRLGYQIKNEVYTRLRVNGSTACPMDSTIMRQVRLRKGCFGIQTKPGVSEYVKIRVREEQ